MRYATNIMLVFVYGAGIVFLALAVIFFLLTASYPTFSIMITLESIAWFGILAAAICLVAIILLLIMKAKPESNHDKA